MSAELVLSGAIFIGLALLIPTIMVLTAVLGPRSGGEAKNAPYESGIEQVVGMADQKFSVKFYLLAILFLIFDIEAVFLYPWASLFRELGWLGFVEMMLFLVVLGVTLVYAWRKGALEWEN